MAEKRLGYRPKGPKNKYGGRRRSAQLKMWLTPEECGEIAAKAREAGMTQADFVLAAVRRTPVVVRCDEEKIAELLRIRYQLSRSGNNLNQIARVLNSAAKAMRIDAVEAELGRIDEAVFGVIETLDAVAAAIGKERAL